MLDKSSMEHAKQHGRICDPGLFVTTIRSRWPRNDELKGRRKQFDGREIWVVAIYYANTNRNGSHSFRLVHTVDIFPNAESAQRECREIGLLHIPNIDHGTAYITREEAILMALRGTHLP